MANASPKEIGTGSYIVAGLGFVPLVGIPFAIAAIVLGLIKLEIGGKKLIALGCLGILFTVVLYGGLFYFGFVQRGGIYDKLRGGLARIELTELVKNIEYYKIINGRYPDSLFELQASLGKQTFNSIYDPTQMHSLNFDPKNGTFYYQLTDDKSHYYLLGVGADQKPFTSDDLLPDLPEQDRAKTGLLLNPSSLPAK
jgi:Type II secretion system (T2SS), protein G